jgi:hypothetical protein
MYTATPEGYHYFFVLANLYSHRYWSILVKFPAEWKTIWPAFVNNRETKVGHQRDSAFLLTDCHKVYMAKEVTAYNESRGIESITTAPHSQWMDLSKRGIQTIYGGARSGLIHGGG